MRIKCWLNMAQTTKLVARYPTYFHGKTLYGIVSNFKNFGVGRTVIRNSLLRYPEPSFYKIVKVELDLSRHFGKTKRFCKVYAHTWFRGEYRGIKGTGAAFKADWRLLQEDELDTFCNLENAPERPVRAVPMYFRAPPLYELHKLQRLKFLNVEAEAPVTLKIVPVKENAFITQDPNWIADPYIRHKVEGYEAESGSYGELPKTKIHPKTVYGDLKDS